MQPRCDRSHCVALQDSGDFSHNRTLLDRGTGPSLLSGFGLARGCDCGAPVHSARPSRAGRLRSAARRMKQSPDQTSSMAQTFVSTSPVSSPAP